MRIAIQTNQTELLCIEKTEKKNP